MIIPSNKKSVPWLPVLVLVAANVLVVLSQDESTLPDGRLSGLQVVCWLIAGGGLLFSLLGLLNYGRRMLSSSAVLTISAQGIDERLSLFSAGSLAWSDITGFRLHTAYGAAMLIIKLKDPQAILNRANFIRRGPQRGAWKRWGSPVVIPQRSINYPLTDLLAVLRQAEARHQTLAEIGPIAAVFSQPVSRVTPPVDEGAYPTSAPRWVDYNGLRMRYHDAHTLVCEEAGPIIDWLSQDEAFLRDFLALDNTYVVVVPREGTPDLIAINHYRREGTPGLSVRVLLSFVGQQADVRELGRSYDTAHAAHYAGMWASIGQQLQVLSQTQALPPITFVGATTEHAKPYFRYV